MIGVEVIGSEGKKLGAITNVKIDEKNWGVIAIEVQLEEAVAKEHKLKRRFKRTRVMINVERIQSVGDRMILKGSNEELLKLIGSTPG